LRRLRQDFGFQIASAVLDDTAIVLAQTVRPRRLVLLLGNEAEGLEREWLEHSDFKVVIPMADQTDSLNVTVAAGIMLHHLTQVAPMSEGSV
jgi:tRNA G18 (ribose-2'-O)-methylase SpoU